MSDWLNGVRNALRRRRSKLAKLTEKIRDSLVNLDPELAEDFFGLLLGVISLRLWVDKDYHRNIEGFKGKYLFLSKDKKISIRAVFKHTRFLKHEYLSFGEGELDDPDITVTFKDSRALMNLLLSPKLDIMGSLLRNDVSVSGNVNYIFKFGFMATQLRQMMLPAM
jgi:hypothetical protein